MKPSGYIELLQTNRNFRRIWLGEVASHLGDWFNTVAIYTLVERLTGSPLAIGLVFITKLLPFALGAPIAGLLNDRLDRRKLMIASDLARAFIVLGLLAIDRVEELPWLYVLIASQVLMSAIFIPAKNASIPNITSERELLTANSLSAATWSALLAIGAGLGGFATELFGETTVFLIDSATYLVSAWMIFGCSIPQTTDRGALGSVQAISDIADGWRHMLHKPEIGRIALAKAAWSLAGGALVYTLLLIGAQMNPAAPAVGIGILYSSRGLGTALGPVLARKYFPNELAWPKLCGLFVVSSGCGYIAVASLPWSLWTVALVCVAHIPSGANWVLSSVLLQKRTQDRYRGRVFASEFLLLTLADSLGVLTASVALELQWLSLGPLIFALAILQVLTGCAWLVTVVPRERAYSAHR